jgi:hypothetical protein
MILPPSQEVARTATRSLLSVQHWKARVLVWTAGAAVGGAAVGFAWVADRRARAGFIYLLHGPSLVLRQARYLKAWLTTRACNCPVRLPSQPTPASQSRGGCDTSNGDRVPGSHKQRAVIRTSQRVENRPHSTRYQACSRARQRGPQRCGTSQSKEEARQRWHGKQGNQRKTVHGIVPDEVL